MSRKTISKLLFLTIAILVALVVIFLPITPRVDTPSENIATMVNRFVAGEAEPQKPVSLIFGGDVMLGRTVMTKSQDNNDYLYPFRYIADTMGEADIAFVNLENPFVNGCRRDYSSMTFCAVPEMSEGLTFAGIDVVTLANNHSRNYGQEGIDTTLKVLSEKNIKVTGLGELVIIEKNGTSFGFLGFDFLANPPSENDYALVRDSDSKVDVLIVSPHWGVEYESATDTQRSWSKRFVSEGADLIVGHHPHVVQSHEIINGVPVYYSLGNLVFDQMWSEETRSGMLLKLSFREGKIESTETINTYIDKWAQPVIEAK